MRHAARRCIVLVGPMGSGKSHVGRLLAEHLGLAFVDVDARIESDARMTIPAIFANEGEPGFRARERKALAEVLASDRQVVASGGGAVLDADNRAAMRKAGRIIYLQVDADEQLRRLEGDSARPLLSVADRAQRLAELQAQREPLYREVADLVIATSRRDPDAIVAEITARLAPPEECRA